MKKEMEDFDRRFAEALSSSVVPMDAVMRYIGAVSGKRLRPRLVFLSARLFGEVTEATWRTALFVELLHTATLIHDDVVDASTIRRGQVSVNARWDNKSAVLAGDYLLSKAMMQLSDPSDSMILKEMLTAAMAMSEGELMQSGELRAENGELRAENGELKDAAEWRVESGKHYLDIIERKTARLIRACCVGGAISVMERNTEDRRQETEDRSRKLELVGEFGLHLGLVFQMRDDILDADDPETTSLAQQLLPEYLDKTLKALEALSPFAKNPDTIEELRSLTLFCAQRSF